MTLGEKIKAFGEEKFGGNVSKYSEATGKNRADLYKYFKGEMTPNGDFIQKLYDLGCDLNWLFSREKVIPNMVSENHAGYSIQRIDYKALEIERLTTEVEYLRKIISSAKVHLEKALVKQIIEVKS